MLYALIPITLLFVLFNQTSRTKDIVHLFSGSLVVWMLILYAITEVLSINNNISHIGILISWIIVCGVLISLIIGLHIKNKNDFEIINIIKKNFNKFSIFLLIISISVIVLSILTVPYNSDSMSYHLPRIMFWVQNKSVAHYATDDARQLCSPMLSEFINLHSYLLLKSDLLFNTIQAFSYVFNIFFVYAISKEIGLNKNERRVATLLYLSMPITVAEAFSTQVDNFATVWMLVFAYECLLLIKKEKLELNKSTISSLIIAGASLGIGYLTKPTVCISMVIFAVALIIVRIIKHDKAKTVILSPLISGFSATVIVIPELLRNVITYNAISDNIVGARQVVGTLNPLYIFVNFIKNLFFTLPVKLINISEYVLYKTVLIISDLLNVDIDSPLISECGRAYHVGTASPGHDVAINPLQVWLFIFSLIIVVYCLIKKRKVCDTYSICSFVSFIAILNIIIWEPYETRYEISYLALICPGVVLVFSNFLKGKNKIAFNSIVSFLCIVSFVNCFSYHSLKCLQDSNQRPIGYFSGYTPSLDSYENVLNKISEKGYTKVGLTSDEYTVIYPFWAIESSIDEIRYVNVENKSAKYEDKEFIPECIILIDESIDFDEYECHGEKYKLVYQENDVYSLDGREIYLFERMWLYG